MEVNGDSVTDDPFSFNETVIENMLQIPGLDRETIMKVIILANFFQNFVNANFFFFW